MLSLILENRAAKYFRGKPEVIGKGKGSENISNWRQADGRTGVLRSEGPDYQTLGAASATPTLKNLSLSSMEYYPSQVTLTCTGKPFV
jgi:hypothetical protein